MRHFVFEDYDSGEEFIVGAECRKEATALAKNLFADPIYLCEFSEFEAENSGLDEY